jgi:hypothetical protein
MRKRIGTRTSPGAKIVKDIKRATRKGQDSLNPKYNKCCDTNCREERVSTAVVSG